MRVAIKRVENWQGSGETLEISVHTSPNGLFPTATIGGRFMYQSRWTPEFGSYVWAVVADADERIQNGELPSEGLIQIDLNQPPKNESKD